LEDFSTESLAPRQEFLLSLTALKFQNMREPQKYKRENQKNDAPLRLKRRSLMQALVFWMLKEQLQLKSWSFSQVP